MLSEAEGRAILGGVFSARGYAIVEDAPFAEGGVSFIADGWDAAARVGYEYLTHEAGDQRDLPPSAREELERRMEAGELFFLLIDERDVDGPPLLAWAAERFLDEVERRRRPA
jgi:hypothetical protein